MTTALAERTAEVEWHGTLASGSGTLRPGGGVVKEIPVDWKSRSEEAEGTTSPEELLAAAHASCYAMSLSLVLVDRGFKPGTLDVTASCALEEIEGGYAIKTMKLHVSADAESGELDESTVQEIAEAADQGCPISNAIRNNVAIEVEASLR
jgi:lipoyl-dependent peroxiredoxin